MKLYQTYLLKKSIIDGLLEDVKPPKRDPRIEKWMRVGLAVMTGVLIPLPGTTELIFFLFDSHRYECAIKCKRDKSTKNQELCRVKCKLQAAAWIVKYMEKEYRKCSKSKRPNKCEKRISKYIITWKQKIEQYKIEYKTLVKHQKREERTTKNGR